MSVHGREGHLARCALWRRKPGLSAATTKRVLVAYDDIDVGDSLVLLLGLKGFPARLATNSVALLAVTEQWLPQVILLDTRIGGDANGGLAKTISERASAQMLLVALSGPVDEEPEQFIQAAGYDGFLQRPCPVWQLADILTNFYTTP
jgi:CheY-like chemotaxis protein